MTRTQRLGLGTVQFGLDYGVSNTAGQVPRDEVARILEGARDAGIMVLDTAAAYGESEAVLGETLLPQDRFAIVSKTIPLRCASIGLADILKIRDGFTTSMARLRRSSLDAILVHDANDLLVPGGERVYAQLREWREAGKVSKIGVSAYDVAQIDAVFSRYDLDLVQLPVNVFDQRLLRDGTLASLNRNGVEIHTRSIVLQGALVTTPEDLPPFLAPLRHKLSSYRALLAANGISPLAGALGFLRHLPEIDVALIGVLSLAQLTECIDAYETPMILDLDQFSIDDPNMIDPRRWPSR